MFFSLFSFLPLLHYILQVLFYLLKNKYSLHNLKFALKAKAFGLNLSFVYASIAFPIFSQSWLYKDKISFWIHVYLRQYWKAFKSGRKYEIFMLQEILEGICWEICCCAPHLGIVMLKMLLKVQCAWKHDINEKLCWYIYKYLGISKI